MVIPAGAHNQDIAKARANCQGGPPVTQGGMRERDFDRRSRRPPGRRGRAGRPGDRRSATPRFHRHDPGCPALLYGWHTVRAALANPARRFFKIYATENAVRRLVSEGLRLPIDPQILRPEEIGALVGPDAVHQGLLAEAAPLPAPDIDEIEPEGILLVLDQITDPHNVGAILRSAAAFAASAVITTSRHSPEATGVLAKAASGALEHVPIVTVPNLARALTALKNKDVLVVGLDSAGDIDLAAAPLQAPLALVLGAEGKGLRHLTRETCDLLARLDLPGAIKSLNVSNATALALYVARARLAHAG